MRKAVALLAFLAAATAAGAVAAEPLTVLPKPRFNAPAKEPRAASVRFVIESSRFVGVSGGSGGGIDGSKSFRGVPLLRKLGALEIYGKDGSSARYVVSPGRYAFDFGKYAYAPRSRPGEREFVYQQVGWAREANGVLYVQTGHSTYARSSYGLNAYLNAIDLGKRKLVWRSPALVSNSGNFVVAGDVIVSGYGFTAERDYLYAIDRSNGHVAGRLALPSAAERITLRGGRLHVRTYDHRLVVRLTR